MAKITAASDSKSMEFNLILSKWSPNLGTVTEARTPKITTTTRTSRTEYPDFTFRYRYSWLAVSWAEELIRPLLIAQERPWLHVTGTPSGKYLSISVVHELKSEPLETG